MTASKISCVCVLTVKMISLGTPTSVSRQPEPLPCPCWRPRNQPTRMYNTYGMSPALRNKSADYEFIAVPTTHMYPTTSILRQATVSRP